MKLEFWFIGDGAVRCALQILPNQVVVLGIVLKYLISLIKTKDKIPLLIILGVGKRHI